MCIIIEGQSQKIFSFIMFLLSYLYIIEGERKDTKKKKLKI